MFERGTKIKYQGKIYEIVYSYGNGNYEVKEENSYEIKLIEIQEDEKENAASID